MNAALWPTDKEVVTMSGCDTWSLRVASAVSGEEGIPSVSLPVILQRKSGCGATLVKMDIEGAEREIFEHSTDWVKAVDHLCIEIHGCWATVMKVLAPYEFQAEMVGEYLCLEFKNGGRREL